MPYLEQEMKFLFTLPEADEIAKRATAWSKTVPERRYEESLLFDTPDLTISQRDARLRLRSIRLQTNGPEINTELCYKRRISLENGVKTEEEIELVLDQPTEKIVSLLLALDFQRVGGYERFRTTYRRDGIKLTIDEFPFGSIVEVEAALDLIEQTVDELQLDRSRIYPKSCDDVYVDLCEELCQTPKAEIRFNDPDMPLFDPL